MREPVVAAMLLAAAVLVSACASGQTFRQGASAAREGDWDAAVEYYRRALQEDSDRPEYRIALQRAMLGAARYHAAAAAELEARGDLQGALRELPARVRARPVERAGGCQDRQPAADAARAGGGGAGAGPH